MLSWLQSSLILQLPLAVSFGVSLIIDLRRGGQRSASAPELSLVLLLLPQGLASAQHGLQSSLVSVQQVVAIMPPNSNTSSTSMTRWISLLCIQLVDWSETSAQVSLQRKLWLCPY